MALFQSFTTHHLLDTAVNIDVLVFFDRNPIKCRLESVNTVYKANRNLRVERGKENE